MNEESLAASAVNSALGATDYLKSFISDFGRPTELLCLRINRILWCI